MAHPTLDPSRRARLRRLLVEYGPLGLAVHYAIYALVLVSFALAIEHRGDASGGSLGATLGVWAAAYLATKLALPLRLLGTVTLTPLLRGAWRRARRAPPPVAAAGSSSASAALPPVTVAEPAQPDEPVH